MVQGRVFAAIFLGSHIFRSFWEEYAQSQLRSDLTEWRVEVHRTRSLLTDYNQVLGSCERDLTRQKWWSAVST